MGGRTEARGWRVAGGVGSRAGGRVAVGRLGGGGRWLGGRWVERLVRMVGGWVGCGGGWAAGGAVEISEYAPDPSVCDSDHCSFACLVSGA